MRRQIVAGWALTALVGGMMPVVAAENVAGRVIWTSCRPDSAFPEFMPLWREGWKQFDERGQRIRHAQPGMPLGAYLHAVIANTGTSPLNVEDVLLNGISLQQAIAPEGAGQGRHEVFASHAQFSKLPREQLETLDGLGDPVWWKADPFTVPPGGFAQVTVRLRRPPRAERIEMRVVGGGVEIAGTVETRRGQAHIVGVGLGPDMKRVFLYVEPARRGATPNRVVVDGVDCTQSAVFASDPAQPVLPVIAELPGATREGAFHLFEVGLDDGRRAAFGLRVHRPDFVYGMWGGFTGSGPAEGEKYLRDLHRHTINTIMSQYGGGVRDYVRSEAGLKLSGELGIQITDHNPGGYPNQRYVFLHDEPDAKDVNSRSIQPLGKRLGSRGRWLVEMARGFRPQAPDKLQLLNIDNTYKPEQWYMYAQLPDVPCADPYYQEQLRSVYHTSPGYLGGYTKPTYVYAAGTIYQSAAAPRPMHLILHSCRFDMPEFPFRPPTPEEKRVEIYYSLGAGARGISFWWYTPSNRYHGLGSDAPEMRHLFAEIGLAGVEIGTAEPVLARACPIDLRIEASENVWVRPLLAGADTVALVVVNDAIASDRVGTLVQAQEKARILLKPPAWLQAREVFEVTPGGCRDFAWTAGVDGLALNLGRLELTRLILVTSDAGLRASLQGRYEMQFAARAGDLIAERERLAQTKQASR